MNPYRRKNKYDMETTSQVMYNLDDLENQIQYNVFTLDEWCEKEIIKIK
jgi:hypothetical protein